MGSNVQNLHRLMWWGSWTSQIIKTIRIQLRTGSPWIQDLLYIYNVSLNTSLSINLIFWPCHYNGIILAGPKKDSPNTFGEFNNLSMDQWTGGGLSLAMWFSGRAKYIELKTSALPFLSSLNFGKICGLLESKYPHLWGGRDCIISQICQQTSPLHSLFNPFSNYLWRTEYRSSIAQIENTMVSKNTSYKETIPKQMCVCKY